MLFALVACARTPAAPKLESETVDVEGFVVPRAADDFRLVDTHAYEPREMGTSVQYDTFYVPEARIDLYLYPVVVPDLFSLASVLHEAQRIVVEGVERVAANRSHPARLETQRLEAVPGVAPPLVGIHAVFDLTDDTGRQWRSHSFLAIRGRHFLKVRFTYAAETEAVGAPAFERFLASVVSPVAQSPAGDPVAVATTVTRTTLVASHDNTCAAAAWIVYGARIADAVGRGEFADTFEREFQARSTALVAWEKLKQVGAPHPKDPCVDASLDAMLQARKLGLFDEYVWHYYAKPYWDAPPDLDLPAFAAFEKRALAGHDPVLEPGIVVRFKDAAH
jgi:hypothetical protein